MKTHYPKYIYTLVKFSFILFLFFKSASSYSQVDESDSLQTGSQVGTIHLGNPPSIIDAYTYDPITDRYIFHEVLNLRILSE